MRTRSSAVVSRSGERRHCLTAASHPARENTNVMAGSNPALSRVLITSARLGGRYSRGCRSRRSRSRPLPRGCQSARRSASRRWLMWRNRFGSTSVLSLPSNKSNSRLPTSMCWESGTGRCSSTTTVVSPRTVWIHPPNSSALLTVADRLTSSTSSGRCRITSSHTAPRMRSARKCTSSITT